MSVKKLHCTALIYLLMGWMACSNIVEITPDMLVRYASWVLLKHFVLEHVHNRKIAHNVISRILYIQLIMLILDSAYAR